MTLENIRIAEKRRRPFKGFLTPVFIQSTALEAMSQMYWIPPNTYEKHFHPSWVRRGIMALFLLTLAVLWCYILVYWQNDPLIYTVVLIALSAFLVFFVYDGFLNKKKNYSIYLDAQGITIAGEFYQWDQLRQTGILEIGYARSHRNYLVLVLNDGRYKKFLLQSFLTFWGFRSAISAYIEYFRNNKLRNLNSASL